MSPQPSSKSSPAASPGRRDASDAAQDEMIGSLGEALAGVSIGSNAVGNGFSFHSNNESNSHSPFPLSGGASANNDIGWGTSFVDTSHRQNFNTQSSNNFSSPSGQNFGSPNGMSAVSQSREESPSEPLTPQRQPSLDLFLSQSPSQALGNDVFKLSSTNLPSLAIPEDEPPAEQNSGFGGFRGQPLAPGPISASPGNFGEIRPNNEVRRRTDSPGTGTTTSSRSVSPYGAINNVDNGRGTIKAYHAYDPSSGSNGGGGVSSESITNQVFGEDDMQSNMGFHNMHGHGSGMDNTLSQRMQSPYGHDGINRSLGFGSPYDPAISHSPQQPPTPQQQQQQQNGGAVNPQQQVLYMAVPTADGRGQVLQPVQMVQLPGKQFAYVVSGSGGVPAVGQAGMGDGQQQQQQQQNQQPMMVLPTMQNQQPNDASGLMMGDGRNDNRNKGIGYGMDNQKHFGDSPISALRTEEYGNPMARNNMASNNQFMTGLGTQPENVSSLYSTPQRPPLDALLGQVRRLSRDQVGCRLVQQALDEEGAMAATLILNEGLPFWGEAMVDPFGNYLFQKILEKITPEERIVLVKSVSTRLVNASLNLHGTRSVQKVVELCALDEQNADNNENSDDSAADILTRALAPAAARLCIDSHGNHVIQRILLKLGHTHSKFVFDAVAASVGDVARHRHGCCVIQRCLDSPPSEARSHLVRRIVDKALELMQDAYGNYVVQYVLDVCADEDVHAVCESVVGKVNLLAIQKFSSNVMEKCLERCTDRVKDQYMQELSDPERIRELMMDPFGNYVVQRALSVATHTQAVRLVEAMRPHLIASQPGTPNGQRNGGVRNTAGGRRIMAKICRRFPNFTLNAVGSREELYSQNKGHHRHQQQQQQQQQHHPSPTMAAPYAQLSPSHHHHQQQQHHPPPPHHAQHFNGNMHSVNVRAHQFDQRQPYYDPAATGYFEHVPHNAHGAYPTL